jgi:Tfp pilus assembly protein PilN
MPIRKSKQINLLPQDEFETSTLGRVLRWALSTFRIMVIVTELFVMSAFLSRFWLDARNSDLNDEISLNSSKVNAFKNIEAEFRSLQQKTGIVKTIYAEPKNSDVITNILKYIPEGVVFNSVSKTEDQVTIRANSFSESSISQFLVNLSSGNDFKEVELAEVSSNFENSSATAFTISAKINKSTTGGSN